MDISPDSNSHPTAAAVADCAPEPNPPPEPAPPPPYQPPDRSLLQQNYFLPPEIQAKLVKYHSDMTQPGATTTYLDDDGDEVTRPLKARETLRHAEELRTYGKLAIGQQKLDDGIEDEDDGKEKTLNDFVTPVVPIAGERMHDEAIALGYANAADLPIERAAEIFAEEQAKYDAAHPKTPKIGRKKPFAIPPEQRNDWVIPQETQQAVLTRLVDMALPDGEEYQRIQPRARLMASRQIGRFLRLGQEQQFLNQRIHDKKPEVDWDAIDKHWTELEAQARVARWEEDKEFYKTHERSIPLRRPRSIPED
jgi:hypothetical protein